jgi:hypothetical protein
LQAFRSCPRFSKELGMETCPEVVEAAELVANTLSVCWEWGLLGLLSVASGVVPKDRFEPAPSISTPSSMWTCLIHPGSTNSSGVLRVTASAVEKMFARQWLEEMAEARDKHAREVAAADGDPAAVVSAFVEPAKRQLLGGGGSGVL